MKELLQSARLEILELRRRNEILTAQMSVVEIFAAVVGLRPQERGMTEDVAWRLQQEIDRLATEQPKEEK